MCNTYTLFRDTLKSMRRGEPVVLTERQRQLLETDGRTIIRPTVPAPVFLADGSIPWMRWGFDRPWSKSINNARIEKRDTMWKKPWEAARCLIPMSGWFEFTGPAGNMTCHLLESQEPGMLLAAGLWEEHKEHGPCFTMIMTEADPESVLGKIHNRMPVILTPEDGEKWLAAPWEDLKPSPGVQFRQSIVPSPLKKKAAKFVQEDLF